MQSLTISPFVLAALALIAAALSGIAGVRRGKAGVTLDHGDNVALQAALRAQANFSELTPVAFLLIAALELSGTASWAVLALGGVLVAARVVHAVAFLGNNGGPGIGRIIGAAGTLFTTVIAALTLVVVRL